MNPTSGGKSSESEILETYLGMLDCDTVGRLFERWVTSIKGICPKARREIIEIWRSVVSLCDNLRQSFASNFLSPRYYADFVLFNYTLEEVLNLAGNAPCPNFSRWSKTFWGQRWSLKELSNNPPIVNTFFALICYCAKQVLYLCHKYLNIEFNCTVEQERHTPPPVAIMCSCSASHTNTMICASNTNTQHLADS